MGTLSQSELVRAGALYVPIVLALAAGLYRRVRPVARLFPATLLSALWTLPSLLLLQQLNLHARWWSYAPGSAAELLGMPLELYLGWAVLWGVVPAPALPGPRTVVQVGLMVLFDVVWMPACKAAVTLGPNWLVGELAAVVLVLLPALVLSSTTRRNTHLGLRATLQLVLAAGLFLYWIPELTASLSHTSLRLSLHWRWLLPIAILLALPGLGGILEFAQRGRGTPIPYDPPARLVTSGIYRYVANPMQLSCVLVMLFWPILRCNAWLVIPVVLAIVYSAGLAAWDEGEDLRARFGEPWVEYRRHVHDWLPRLTPFAAGEPATLYFAHTCVACSELGRWIAAQHPLGLTLLPAESLAEMPNRLMYIASTGDRDHGTRALACALEHINLGYALAGVLLRLPGPAHLAQLVMDTSGFEAQTLQSTQGTRCSIAGSQDA